MSVGFVVAEIEGFVLLIVKVIVAIVPIMSLWGSLISIPLVWLPDYQYSRTIPRFANS